MIEIFLCTERLKYHSVLNARNFYLCRTLEISKRKYSKFFEYSRNAWYFHLYLAYISICTERLNFPALLSTSNFYLYWGYEIFIYTECPQFLTKVSASNFVTVLNAWRFPSHWAPENFICTVRAKQSVGTSSSHHAATWKLNIDAERRAGVIKISLDESAVLCGS